MKQQMRLGLQTKNFLKTVLRILPRKIRHQIMRKSLHLPTQFPADVRFKVAETAEEYIQSFSVLHDSYLRAGYVDPVKGGLRILPHHCLPSTSIIVAKINEKVVGTVTIIRDTSMRLPMDQIFDLSSFRKRNLRIAEVSSLSIHPKHRGSHGLILHGLFRYIAIYAREHLKCDLLSVTVNPKMVNLYSAIICFEHLNQDTVQSYGFVKGAPAVGMIVDLVHLEEVTKRIYGNAPAHQNLNDFYFRSSFPNFEFPKRKFPFISDNYLSDEFIKYLLTEKTEILQSWSFGEKFQILAAARFDPVLKEVLLPRHATIQSAQLDRWRHDVWCPVELQNIAGTIAKGEAWDLSQGGLKVHVPIEENSHPSQWLYKLLRFSLQLENGETVSGTAKVVWKSADGFMGLQINTVESNWSQLFGESVPFRRSNRKCHAD